jgi:iron complex transport system substrate-binding protein
MQQRINAVTQKVATAPKVTVYMEVGFSPPPPYAFGGGSFGDDLIIVAGGTNIFAGDTANGGFPQVSEEDIIKDSPQVIILTEDPQYGGDPTQVAKRPGWSQIAAVQNHRVYAINPDLAERPGPRMVDALEQLAKDLHPDLF